MALEGQIDALTKLLTQFVEAKPVVQAPAAPAPARVDDWIPKMRNIQFSRPPIAIFDCDVAAFEFRAERAALVAPTPVAVRNCWVGAEGAEFRGYVTY